MRAHRRRRRLEPRPLHHGRRSVARRADHLQAAVRRRVDLSGRATGELVARAADRDLRPRGEVRGRRGRTGVVPVRLDERRRTPPRGGDDPDRDDARATPRSPCTPTTTATDTWSARPCRTPFLDREIIVVADAHVDPEFGTGAVKVTPAHDPNDFEIGLRHNLPMPTMLDTTGRSPIPEPNSTAWTASRPASRCARRSRRRAGSSPRSGRICTASDTPSAAGNPSSRVFRCSGGSRSSRWPRPPATRCATATR